MRTSQSRRTSKWPEEVVLFRHLPSAYNVNRTLFNQTEIWREFCREYDENYRSSRARKLAAQLKEQYSLGCGDWNTPIIASEAWKGEAVGRALVSELKVPDVVLHSPYLRALETWDALKRGHQGLAAVKIVWEARLREQEHGLATTCPHWKIFQVLYPEQRELYEKEGPYWYRYPQGESVPDVQARQHSLIDTLTRSYAGKRVWLIGHHLGILAMMAALERWDDKEFLRMDREEKPINAGVTLYRCNPGAGQNGRLERIFYNRNFYEEAA